MAKPSVARAPDTFCTVPEMQGLITEPPIPINTIAPTISTASRAPTVTSSEIVTLSWLPPSQTG